MIGENGQLRLVSRSTRLDKTMNLDIVLERTLWLSSMRAFCHSASQIDGAYACQVDPGQGRARSAEILAGETRSVLDWTSARPQSRRTRIPPKLF
jgi:hypothetical protein